MKDKHDEKEDERSDARAKSSDCLKKTAGGRNNKSFVIMHIMYLHHLNVAIFVSCMRCCELTYGLNDETTEL